MGRESRRFPFTGRKPLDPIIPTTSLDRLGNPLQKGDEVYLLAKQDAFWQVVEITPRLDPGAAPGAVTITFVSVFSPTVPGGQRLMDVLKVRDASEFQPEGQESAQPEPPEPPMGPTLQQAAEPKPKKGPRRVE